MRVVLEDGVVRINNFMAPRERGCIPCVNELFRSAAEIYSSSTLAIILTGMGGDGTDGGKALKEAGSFVIAQDEASSAVWGMPGTAVKAGIVDEILPLMKIPEAVKQLVNR